MYHKHHTKGLVLQSRGEGADSCRIHILTGEFGLINARVQGGRNIHSKLRSGAQDFSFGDFSLIHGKAGWKLVSVRVIKNFFESLKHSNTKVVVMSKVLSLVKKLVGEDEGEKNLFVITTNFLDFLVESEEQHLPLVECLVLLRILHSLGYMRYEPELGLPINSKEIEVGFLEQIAPKRSKIVGLINESLKATHLT